MVLSVSDITKGEVLVKLMRIFTAVAMVIPVTRGAISYTNYCMKCTCGKTAQEACNANNICYMGLLQSASVQSDCPSKVCMVEVTTTYEGYTLVNNKIERKCSSGIGYNQTMIYCNSLQQNGIKKCYFLCLTRMCNNVLVNNTNPREHEILFTVKRDKSADFVMKNKISVLIKKEIIQYPEGPLPASNAIQLNDDCSQSGKDSQPYWQTDMVKNYEIEDVVIKMTTTNTTEKFRVMFFKISLSMNLEERDGALIDEEVCYNGYMNNTKHTMKCQVIPRENEANSHPRGRYFRVTLNLARTKQYYQESMELSNLDGIELSLCDVHAYGDPWVSEKTGLDSNTIVVLVFVIVPILLPLMLYYYNKIRKTMYVTNIGNTNKNKITEMGPNDQFVDQENNEDGELLDANVEHEGMDYNWITGEYETLTPNLGQQEGIEDENENTLKKKKKKKKKK